LEIFLPTINTRGPRLNSPLRIALIGAGIMGQQHYQHLKTLTEATLCAVADPGPQAPALAANGAWRISPITADAGAGEAGCGDRRQSE
jgi:predicted dehydrogenase